MSKPKGFIDNSDNIKAMLQDALIKSLYESGDIIKTQTQRNCRVDTGHTKKSWDCVVDEGDMIATIGNPEENAYWEEFGTGEYAANGKGRKGGWWYKNPKASFNKDGSVRKNSKHPGWIFTYGKPPQRTFFNAYLMKRGAVIKCFKKNIKDKFK